MAFRLSEPELDNAFQAIEHHGYSALLPQPPEWAEVKAHWPAVREAIARLDLDTYRPYPVLRMYAPKSRINIRPVSLVHPQDLVIYTALVLIAKDDIEAARIKKPKNRVFSYRSDGSRADRLYVTNGSYDDYTKRRRRKADSAKYVAITDIADFYPRLNRHRLENVLKTVAKSDRAREVARVLDKLCTSFARLNSYGVPVGPPASRVLGEAVLIDVDDALVSEGCDFVRWVDDYTFFCDSQHEAQQCLFCLAEWLYNEHGLTLQPIKTRIATSAQFKYRLGRNFEARLKARSTKLLKIFKGFRDEDPYADTTAPFEPDSDTLEVIHGTPLVAMLKKAINRKESIDYEAVEFILGRVGSVRQIGDKVRRELLDVVLLQLETLYPVIENVTKFLASFTGLSAGRRRKIGKDLLRPLTRARARPPDYYAVWVLHMLAEHPDWADADAIRALYSRTTALVVKRYAALALFAAGNRSHALAVRDDVHTAVPMLKTAILLCSRRLGTDERRFWKDSNRSVLLGTVEGLI